MKQVANDKLYTAPVDVEVESWFGFDVTKKLKELSIYNTRRVENDNSMAEGE